MHKRLSPKYRYWYWNGWLLVKLKNWQKNVEWNGVFSEQMILGEYHCTPHRPIDWQHCTANVFGRHHNQTGSDEYHPPARSRPYERKRRSRRPLPPRFTSPDHNRSRPVNGRCDGVRWGRHGRPRYSQTRLDCRWTNKQRSLLVPFYKTMRRSGWWRSMRQPYDLELLIRCACQNHLSSATKREHYLSKTMEMKIVNAMYDIYAQRSSPSSSPLSSRLHHSLRPASHSRKYYIQNKII